MLVSRSLNLARCATRSLRHRFPGQAPGHPARQSRRGPSGNAGSGPSSTGPWSAIVAHLWGEMPGARAWLDGANLLILVGGGIVALALGVSRPAGVESLGALILLSGLVQPLLEELLFRGFLQGRLLARARLRRSLLGISAANVVTTAAFVALHLLHNPVHHAVLVAIPSLAYGYSRERSGGVALPFAQHATHNVLLFLGFALGSS